MLQKIKNFLWSFVPLPDFLEDDDNFEETPPAKKTQEQELEAEINHLQSLVRDQWIEYNVRQQAAQMLEPLRKELGEIRRANSNTFNNKTDPGHKL